MANEPPFDVWDGQLEASDDAEPDTAEEAALHLDPESEHHRAPYPNWSELTGGAERPDPSRPVSYFADEQPDVGEGRWRMADEHEPGLHDFLERQHYSFPTSPKGR